MPRLIMATDLFLEAVEPQNDTRLPPDEQVSANHRGAQRITEALALAVPPWMREQPDMEER